MVKSKEDVRGKNIQHEAGHLERNVSVNDIGFVIFTIPSPDLQLTIL